MQNRTGYADGKGGMYDVETGEPKYFPVVSHGFCNPADKHRPRQMSSLDRSKEKQAAHFMWKTVTLKIFIVIIYSEMTNEKQSIS